MNRRDFVKFVVAGSIAAGCPLGRSLLATTDAPNPLVDGEENRICHQVRDGSTFTPPPVFARHDFVIVGGGMSGLTAAYLLRDQDFLLLEKEAHFGGNAHDMTHKGMPYAAGGAFIWSGDAAYPLAKEIGLDPLPINNWDGSLIKGEYVPDTWGDGLDKLPYTAAVRESFKKFKKELLAMDLEKREKELYGTPLSTLLNGYAPEIKQWWDAFGPANWGATSDESAAAEAVTQVQWCASDNRQDIRFTWPGGIGVFGKRLTDILQNKAAKQVMAGSTTVSVIPEKTQVKVVYMQAGELKTVAAKTVIVAAPKLIARRLVQGLPQKQSEAMAQIRYIPYAVVNLIFDKPIFNKGYDTICPGNSFSDFIVADWVVQKQPDYKSKFNILTFYVPMKESERALLLTEKGTRTIAAKVLSDFQKLFVGSNVNPKEVHIFRRGHPVYKTTPGLYTQVQPIARQPMDRVFFANTDSEGPESSTSTAIAAAQRAVAEAKKRLAV